MHKRIGILGGMSPESTAEYYRHITHADTDPFGDFSFTEIIIYSVNFPPYVDWPKEDRWDLVAEGLSQAARSLEAAGAVFIIIAINTIHLAFDQVQANFNVPMLSLPDATGETILARGLKMVGLLGTRFTMEKTFYHEALAQKGISVLVPEADQRTYVNNVSYNELTAGQIRDDSRSGFVTIINRLAERGAEGVVLGCTEIPLLIDEDDVEVPLLDTTAIHAEAVLDYALA